MDELKFNDTEELKFHHTKKGIIARYKKQKFILGTLSISQEKESFSHNELLNLSKDVIEYESSIRDYPKHQIELDILIEQKKIINNYTPFYKYMSKNIFENKILKGKWQLGNINQYRTIENKNQRDEFEGFSFINLNINKHIVSQVCNSGFNYLIFCGTRSNDSNLHKRKFGEKKIYIHDVKSFAEEISKEINAEAFYIQNIEYNTLKSYYNPTPLVSSEIDINNILTSEYFDVLQDNLLYTSLFVKPEAFRDENEVRIIFKMAKDYNKPFRFKNKTILKYINFE